MNRRIHRWRLLRSLACIAIAALTLRAVHISGRSIWFDEACCWRMASFPVREIIDRGALDRAPPLYYLVLKAWMACVGESVAALRGLSVLWGVLTCVGVYLAAVQAYRLPAAGARAARARTNARWIGLSSATFAAVSVLHIRWSCEAKMYAQTSALAVLSGWLLLRALAPPKPSGSRWFLYILSAIAFGYSHNYAPFSLLAQVIFAFGWVIAGSERDVPASARLSTRLWELVKSPRFRVLALACGLVAIAGLAWLPVLDQQLKRTSMHPLAPLRTWNAWMACYQLFIDPQSPFVPRGEADAVSAATLALLAALLWRPVPGDWFLFLSAAVPPGIAAIISYLGSPVFHSHYLQFAHLFLLAGAARVLSRIPVRSERLAGAAFVVFNMLVVNHQFFRGLDSAHRPGIKAASAMIDHARERGSLVVVVSPFYFSPVLYYLGDRRNCYLFDNGRPLEAWEGPAIMRPEDFIDRKNLGQIPGSQLWLVNVDSPGTSWEREPLLPPNGWDEVARKRFQEVYFVQGSAEIVEYRRQVAPVPAKHE